MEQPEEGFDSDDLSLLSLDIDTADHAESADTADTADSADNDRNRKAKKHRKRYVVNLFPRIIKSDIRRFYPRMLANTCNSHDPILISSFLRTYCLPDFTSSDILPSEIAHNDGFQTEFSLAGLGLATIAFILQFDLMPDSTMLILGSSIKQFRDDPNRSEIYINMEFSGTKLFEVVRPESLSDSDAPEQSTMLTSVALEIDKYLDMARCLPTSSPVPVTQGEQRLSHPSIAMPMIQRRLSDSPFFMSNQCTLKIVLDGRHRLCSMECATDG